MLRAHFLGSHGQFVRPRGKYHRVARRALLVLELIQGACPVGPRRRRSGWRNGTCQWRCYRRPLHRRTESKWMKFLAGARKPKSHISPDRDSLDSSTSTFAFTGYFWQSSCTTAARKRRNEVAGGSLGTRFLQFRRSRQFRQRLRSACGTRVTSRYKGSVAAKSVFRR